MDRILAIIHENLSRSTQLQQSFLEHQTQILKIIASEIESAKRSIGTIVARKPLITKTQLQEFGCGSIAKCFGPDFAILDQRRSPRIPNGDLLMIDRVLSIEGKRANLNPPAAITSEYDVPADIWFMRENSYTGVPLAILMEIALQPCGILSAYLGSALLLPVEVNLFRNLDGTISFSSNLDLRGKTITNHSRLLSSVSGAGMLIQKFAFELEVEGQVFLAGESSFGYFTQVVMEKQTGLDIGENQQSTSEDQGNLVDDHSVELHVPSSGDDPSNQHHLDLLDKLYFKEKGGRYNNGIISGEKQLNGNEWFYANHFYQDPVMPGSLGIEAIVQGMSAYVWHIQPENSLHKPVFEFSSKDALIWKYRGQVIPANRGIHFEVHLKTRTESDLSIKLTGDADFWVDGVQIYSVNNLSITSKKESAR